MSTLRTYSWDDAGSPGRNLTGNYQNKIKQILKACLIDGYGDKLAAGWEMVHEHPNGFSMTNGDGYINLVSGLAGMSDRSIHIYQVLSVTGTTGAILEGEGLCSGDYHQDRSETGSRHMISLASVLSRPALTRWLVVADHKTCILAIYRSSVSYEWETLYFGNTKPLTIDGSSEFVVLGGLKYSSASYDPSHFFKDGTIATDPGTGLVNLTGKMPTTIYSKSSSGSSPELHSIDTQALSEFSLSPDFAVFNNKIFGYLRGVAVSIPLRHALKGQSYLALGLPNTDDSILKVSEIDGYKFMCFQPLVSGVFLTDDVRFW